MSTVDDEPLAGDGARGNLYQEADKLLRLAEELQEKCEACERRLTISLFIGAGITWGLIWLAVSLSVALRTDEASIPRIVMVLMAFIYAFGIASFHYLLRQRAQQRMRRDKRALFEIVDMLRDLEKGIAEKNNLSTLERAEFRIRLSRFEIGPGRAIWNE